MNSPQPPDDSLLRALLEEAAPADFRATTLAATLRGARCRRILRRTRSASAALVLPLLAALLLLAPRRAAPTLSTHPAPAHPVPTASLAGCEIIHTRPAPELRIATRPLAADQRLASAPLESAARIRTSPIEAGAGAEYPRIKPESIRPAATTHTPPPLTDPTRTCRFSTSAGRPPNLLPMPLRLHRRKAWKSSASGPNTG